VNEQEQTKDLCFYEPREPQKYDKTKTQRRDFTVAEVEEVMWRIRASGGTDSTPVQWFHGSYRDGEHTGSGIKALHVEAFPIEVPLRRREPQAVVTPPPPAPAGPPWWQRPAEALGLLLAAVGVAVAVAYLLGLVL
jgi:hypothetical protein